MFATILHISGYGTNSYGGGIKAYIKNLLKHLNNKEFKYFLLAKNGIPGVPGEIVVPGNSITFIIKAFIRCLSLKPDVVHSHANWYCLIPGLMYKLISKTTVIHTLHSVPEKRYAFLTRLFFRFLLRACDHVNFVSVFLRDYYDNIEKIKLNNTGVIYPGSDHGVVQYSEKETHQFLADFLVRKDAFIILAQGLTSHLLKYKGAIVLLKAFARLIPEYPHLILLITKQGKYLGDLQRLAGELDIHDSVKFTRNLEDPLLAHAVANVYAHITLGEGGVSFSILEAMAAGNPIIATGAGGIPELLKEGDTALLINADEHAVYYALKQIIENPQLGNDISSRARHHAAEHFRWTVTARHFETLYISLMKHNP